MRLVRLLALILAAALSLPVAALADGDPASDVLLGQNVFYPYSPPVSPALQRALDAETGTATRASFPIKVALIASPVDLGVIPGLFGQPQKYADFLDQEISFQSKQSLLVVMASGFGVQGLPPAAAAAARSLPKPSGSQSDDLARAAIAAIPKLAAAAGRPLHSAGTASARTGGGSRTLLIVILALAAALTAAALVAVRQRRTRTR